MKFDKLFQNLIDVGQADLAKRLENMRHGLGKDKFDGMICNCRTTVNALEHAVKGYYSTFKQSVPPSMQIAMKEVSACEVMIERARGAEERVEDQQREFANLQNAFSAQVRSNSSMERSVKAASSELVECRRELEKHKSVVGAYTRTVGTELQKRTEELEVLKSSSASYRVSAEIKIRELEAARDVEHTLLLRANETIEALKNDIRIIGIAFKKSVQ